MSQPNPKNFEDPADEFPVSLPPPPHGRTRNGKLTETYHLWLNNLEPPLQESLGKLIWKLHEYRDDLSVSQKSALIDLLTEPCSGMLDRLSQRTRATTQGFLTDERLKEDERREDHHGA
ncbi:hypothetical protein [uncultured Mediterranean phage uvDeep-CGR2-AD3-C76]|nr:hypothetical protein [uncultured Mediterranean phage uvDeep-CGR2-AD3-C76]